MIEYLQKNAGEIITALGQHIYISVIAAVIAIAIAVPLAIGLIDHPKGGEIVSQIAGVIQTIPSLAILGLLIPLVGIGTLPAIIALVLYAIMPIFQNSYSGLTNIDPILIEAADAFGVSKRFKLFRFQLPLALPMIISGIRIAVVLIIGTTTLAALIGGGGLGTYILVGIQTNDDHALIVGAVLSALLALLANAIIKVLGRISLKKIVIVIGTLLIMFGGYTITSKLLAQRTQTITIAGKMGGEPEILINMYKDLIEADSPNVNVELKPNFGGTSFLFKALNSGKVDIYPEFTGTVMQSLVQTPDKVSHNPQKSYQEAKRLLQKQFGLSYLKPMKYENNYALAVRSDEAKKYKLSTLSDLTKASDQLTAAFDPDFYQQSDGYPGLKMTYGIEFLSVKTMEPALRYQALADRKIDVTDAYTTDPQLRQYKLTTLKDDHGFFPSYQGAPLMKTSFAKKNPQIVKSLNQLADKISTTEMQEMNYQVSVKHRKAAVVAKEYLIKHKLIDE